MPKLPVSYSAVVLFNLNLILDLPCCPHLGPGPADATHSVATSICEPSLQVAIVRCE